MPNKAKITLEGHCGKDAEYSQTANGKDMVKFSIAQTVKGKDNTEETVWYNITVFGYGTYQAKNFKKGDPVQVVGDLSFYVKTEQDVNGADIKISIPQITAFEAHKIAWFKKGEGVEPQPPKPQPDTHQEEDNLPF
jgi:single-stranded DNA-binding protein